MLARRSLRHFLFVLVASALAGCGSAWNDPYPASESGQNILYTAFTERPKHLDPAVAYAEDQYTFIAQIYEPPLQYHYLKRPYELIPATAESVPHPRYFDAAGRELPSDAAAAQVARSVYTIRIKPGIRYQPHPAFAEYGSDPVSMSVPPVVPGFKEQGTRELVAADYVYGIKRLAHPALHSPILGFMSTYIEGLGELGKQLDDAYFKRSEAERKQWIDLDAYPLAGATVVDRFTYRITLKGKYPQFQYWLAMPFFAPVPREADRFYAQPGMAERNLSFDWYPVGTGPYYLAENDPNRRMALARNPHFRGEAYPCDGEAADREAGLLADCGQAIPFIDRVVFSLEKETIPYWNKFLQGYYDASGISSDSFDQAIRIGDGGEVGLTETMRERGISLLTAVRASTFYLGFNMLDPTVGGLNESARKLRQAISIAIDQEEFIAIFMNGRGQTAMSPLPPGIFGFADGPDGVNPVTHRWVAGANGGRSQRRPIEDAKRLLAEAGYPNGRDAKTGEPLVVNLDTTSAGMGDKPRHDWLTRQFAKIDIQLVIRSTDFNRFQEKLRKGAVQLYYLGWNADYPDPENFFFLLYGPESKAASQGENAANYQSPLFDRDFARMKHMDNTPERLRIIREMIATVQQDAPWVFGFHPKSYALSHAWLSNRKPNNVANNTLKYQRVDAAQRARARAAWNRPVVWPLWLLGALLVALAWPVYRQWRRHEGQSLASRGSR